MISLAKLPISQKKHPMEFPNILGEVTPFSWQVSFAKSPARHLFDFLGRLGQRIFQHDEGRQGQGHQHGDVGGDTTVVLAFVGVPI